MYPTKFTPDSELELLFSPDYIPNDVKSVLDSDLHIRPLASTDYYRGHLNVLKVLTEVSDPGIKSYQNQFHSLKSINTSSPSPTYFTLVILSKSTDTVVAVGTLFIERKFLRGLGNVGHIEDIAVDKTVQGKKLGLRVIQALVGISENYGLGCYKTILNCSDSNVGFYEKCGFVKKENEMAKYTPKPVVQSPKL